MTAVGMSALFLSGPSAVAMIPDALKAILPTTMAFNIDLSVKLDSGLESRITRTKPKISFCEPRCRSPAVIENR